MPDILKGSTDVTRYIMMVDSASGAPETALTIANFDLQYTRNRTAPAAKVDATALAATDTAHTDNRAIEIDATSSPGLYRVDWPDAAFATGVDKVTLVVTCTGCAPSVEAIDLVNYNSQDGVRLGLTALPNAAADAAGGLPISDAGGLDLDAKLANTNEVTAARMGALTDWINGGRLDLILDDILLDTGTTLQGELDGIQADTEDIQGRLPAALVSGRIDASVGAMAANVMTAAAAAADLTTELQTGLATAASIAALNNLSAAQVNAEVDTALSDCGITAADGVDRIAGKSLRDGGTGGYLIGGP